jgi:hypothetical protein
MNRRLVSINLAKWVLVGLLFSGVAMPLGVFAEGIQVVASNHVFFGPDPNKRTKLIPYAEVHWEIYGASLTWLEPHFEAKILTTIIATTDTGKVYETSYILQTPPFADSTGVRSQRIGDIARFFVPVGKTVSVSLTLTDLNAEAGSRAFTYKDTLRAEPLTGPRLSSLQIVDTAFGADKLSEPRYEKDGQVIIPLSGAYLAEGRHTLHYYAEVYQPQALLSPYLVSTWISRKAGEDAVNKLSRMDTAAVAPIGAMMGKLPTATLGSGNYYLNMALLDDQLQTITVRSSFFQLQNAKPEPLPVETQASRDTTLARASGDLAKTVDKKGKTSPE